MRKFDIQNYWRARANKAGLTFLTSNTINQDGPVCSIGDGNGYAGLSVTGLELMQNKGPSLRNLARSRFDNAVETLKKYE